MSRLVVKNLSFRRGTGPEAFHLQIPELAASTGQMLALHGPSGLGKSTCLELLAGVVQPDHADLFSLVMDDKSTIDFATPGLNLAPFRTGPIGYGPQTGGLLGFLDARSNARAALDLTGQRRDPILCKRFDRLAAELDLEDCLGKSRGALSGGQRKRVTLLRALAVPRQMLVLDEPTAGLDDQLADRTIACISRICAEEGTICVAAMHDMPRAANFGMSPLQLRLAAGGAQLGVCEEIAA